MINLEEHGLVQDGYVLVTFFRPPRRKPVINVYHFTTLGKAKYQQSKFKKEVRELGETAYFMSRIRPLYKESDNG